MLVQQGPYTGQHFQTFSQPKTQKEIEQRVAEAKKIREESKTEANQLREEAALHGKKAIQAQKGIETCDKTINQAQEEIKKAEERNAKRLAMLARINKK